ncbi:hypothetical protein ASPVEDRAFT_88410 [Aspergillus versicolor CBS 583.65]|uniref:Saccharopine dehydrogenase NADP binding domain-containing protein n=1 Tax=Aspergillus versicolor CBS 583.65 TaxID=1036611 RepID=A0A1L9Q093_ASPVE|nr:uncharacterized protein ASPVEDRAFT_88410 [Aspergillus versicolor CBS 583.65]OJJ07155.1 hypothetical protein ASPVEDRAFT_88410 [Aspergillus versicolor CBS 583.65]
MAPLIIYGATGYTGQMASENAKALNLDFSIAGRTNDKLQSLASSLDVPYSVLDVNNHGLIDSALKDASVLLNCAGPFIRTAKPLMEACIRNKVHYLDVSAELGSYQQAYKLDEDARNAHVMLLPGCGGSVAMLGCLAGHAVEIEPTKSPTNIDIALHVAGAMSRGSAISAAGTITEECLQVVNNSLAQKDPGEAKEFNFYDGNGYVASFPVALPDLFTLQISTNAPNIRTYVHTSGDSFPTGDLQSLPRGPTDAQRKASPYSAAVTVTFQDGTSRTAVLHTVNGYTFTGMAAVEAAKRVLDHQVKAGFQTPVQVFGKEFIHSVPGSEIKKVHLE